ncbi:hypothetical protein HYFRA_00007943 [Hymenoscyphus fraxineus]|uniref:2EXR domain-containing protein n=1 Tax=Hymenoscyphus fraxineus TaxID=746836 RepID=A0A9N9KQC6_9HELO|nr:hypothetical protein HYFRA_00007943 [Hymenoscyphus fraxineus]
MDHPHSAPINTALQRPWDNMSLLDRQSTPPTFGPDAGFVYFKYLPQELRLHIWGCVELPPKFKHGAKYRVVRPYERPPIPAVLHACSESRDEFLAKENVKKNHPTYFRIPLQGPGNPRTMIFSERDRVEPLRDNLPEGKTFFNNPEFRFMLSKIRYINLQDHDIENWLDGLHNMTSLREIWLDQFNPFDEAHKHRYSLDEFQYTDAEVQRIEDSYKQCFPGKKLRLLVRNLVIVAWSSCKEAMNGS